jgi:uncharacterized YigZ family protein
MQREIMAELKPALIPGGEARVEIEIDRSRFIACAAPAFTVEEARAFIQRVKDEFPDASHHVPAFLIGHGAGVTAHCGDDGEPAGTAGRPALVVLQGSGLGDIVVVVTRYFGGIKLGTGGLVRAYTAAVQEVLRAVPLAERVATEDVMLAFPYTYVERVRETVARHGGILLEEDFGADVTVAARFRAEKTALFADDIKNLTRGTVETIITGRNPNTIVAVGSLGGQSIKK